MVLKIGLLREWTIYILLSIIKEIKLILEKSFTLTVRVLI
jgi:hypothetical protein